MQIILIRSIGKLLISISGISIPLSEVLHHTIKTSTSAASTTQRKKNPTTKLSPTESGVPRPLLRTPTFIGFDVSRVPITTFYKEFSYRRERIINYIILLVLFIYMNLKEFFIIIYA